MNLDNANHAYKTGLIYTLPVSGVDVASGYCKSCGHIHTVFMDSGLSINIRALPVEDRVVILHAQIRVLPN